MEDTIDQKSDFHDWNKSMLYYYIGENNETWVQNQCRKEGFNAALMFLKIETAGNESGMIERGYLHSLIKKMIVE